MATINIPPPRIPVIDARTGSMSQAWYVFFAQFLQGISDGGTTTTVDLTALTARTTVSEGSIDLLEAENANLFVDIAMPISPNAQIDELRKRITDLEADYRPSPVPRLDEFDKRIADLEADYTPDPTAALNALHNRIADLELQISMITRPEAAIDELRKRVADLETDMEFS